MTDLKKIDVDFTTSRGLSAFLLKNGISLVLTTYQTGNVFFIGPDVSDKLAIQAIMHERPMGIAASGDSLFIGGKNQIWRFNNILPPDKTHQEHDKFFVPQTGWTIGDLDCHDLALERSGRPIFVSTLYSCVCSISDQHSFNIIWTPPWISSLETQDRCHLNGLAVKDGALAFVTSFAQSDTKESWRETKNESGVVFDTKNKRVVCGNLSMPHSPRWHDDKLWLLESGTGSLGVVDSARGEFLRLIQIPGYLRGLTFFKNYVIVGSSVPREGSGITGGPFVGALDESGSKQHCGIFIVDVREGKLVHSITITGAVQEIYDIAVLPQTKRPGAIALGSEELSYMLNYSTQ